MKRLIPLAIGVAGAVAVIGTAIANVNGLFAGHLRLAYLCWGVAVALLVLAALFALMNPEKLHAAQLKFDFGKLCKFGPTDAGERGFIVPVTVELLQPSDVKIKGCAVRLSRRGVTERLKVLNDVERYDLHNSRSVAPERIQRLTPLPSRLQSGDPTQAWVHFVTNRSEHEIQSGELKLIVRTSCGNGNAIIPSQAQYWDDGSETFVARRR